MLVIGDLLILHEELLKKKFWIKIHFFQKNEPLIAVAS
jgi:hypothetical protein